MTQNVRDFKQKDRRQWLAAWRSIPKALRPALILVQETHVKTNTEVTAIDDQWKRLWGWSNENQPMSYWSTGPVDQGGVGILIFPEYLHEVEPWNIHLWTPRSLGVVLSQMHVLNIYAPAPSKPDRDAFFDKLGQWRLARTESVIMGGDFNCVEVPVLDRLGGHRPDRSESAPLSRLVKTSELTDARMLLGSALTDLRLEPTEHFTYWTKEHASRIDPFYVARSRSQWVQWLDVQLPPVPSDHNTVSLHLRDPASRPRRQHSRPANYPFGGRHNDRLAEELREEVAAIDQENPAEIRSESTSADTPRGGDWDEWLSQCKTAIQTISTRDAQRRQILSQKLTRQLQENAQTRKQLLDAFVQDIKEKNLSHFGNILHRTPEDIRWLYRRTAIWERDQRVSRIESHGDILFHPDDSIPERFAKAWKPLMGQRHSLVDAEAMESEVRSFVQIPSERTVSDAENTILLAPISEEDVLAAISRIQRHKAAGEDGLNNDFYRDCASEIAPKLGLVCNDLLQGHPPPPSFLKAIVVPLRKKGDSPNAMDYRPISLLQSSYKIFAKILAMRLQKFLGRLIGNTQQGFVHGRQLGRSVAMMVSMLETRFHEEGGSPDDSPGILLLDFAKAYDTVDRVYLMEVLRQFGFAKEFVSLMERLHLGTTAHFLVNGEKSQAMEVRSGIRQGCPLAPLLFILAVEVLAIAVTKQSTITGMTVPGDPRKREHKFSAFVDDSSLFLQHSSQLPDALEVIQAFGRISGLHVQPAKSCFIFLNTAVVGTEWHGIPVLQQGRTQKYLGYELGVVDQQQVNWAQRIRAIKRRMVTAEEASTTVQDRVDLFNTVVLPAILFTAKVFAPPPQVLELLINIQKQFIWKKQMKDDPSRHKMPPLLIFQPREAGGLGLVAIPVAIQTQRVTGSMLWLLSQDDEYKAAWRFWVGIQHGEGVSPRRPARKKAQKAVFNPQQRVRQELGEFLAPSPAKVEQITRYVHRHIATLSHRTMSEPRSATRQPQDMERIEILVDLENIPFHQLMPREVETFIFLGRQPMDSRSFST